jgi:signal transduction histidine kinase
MRTLITLYLWIYISVNLENFSKIKSSHKFSLLDQNFPTNIIWARITQDKKKYILKNII